MEIEERAHYQKKLDDVKNNMAWITSLLEQHLQAQLGEGTSNQQQTLLPPLVTLVTIDP
jgi:hypothetical protein